MLLVPPHLLIPENLFQQALFLLARFPYSYKFSLECKFAHIDKDGYSYTYLDRASYTPVDETTKRYVKQELYKLEKVQDLLVNPTKNTLICFNYVKSVMDWLVSNAPTYEFLDFSKELDNAFYLLDLEEAQDLLELETNPF